MMPVCSLALGGDVLLFVWLLAISGAFSNTFTLTFAYISDCIKDDREKRVAAYGLALATFGLSYTIGPMLGGYLANSKLLASGALADGDGEIGTDEEKFGDEIDLGGAKLVFIASLVLTILDLAYIWFILPESTDISLPQPEGKAKIRRNLSNLESWRDDVIPNLNWTPLDALRIFSGDPLLAEIGRIVLLYYTGVWAIVSTFVLYAAKRFHFGPERLGELMSAFGLCTMVAEAVLVRIIVPAVGEIRSMQYGLIAFALQCAVLAFAFEGWQLFLCVFLSTMTNLVYPSLTSLISHVVADDAVGEALGAINGVKALTEGIGPLLFGGLMTLSENSRFPGWPYLLASVFSLLALARTRHLPTGSDNDRYINEKYSGAASKRQREGKIHGILSFFNRSGVEDKNAYNGSHVIDESEDELVGLLSEIDSDTDIEW
eukprot:CAMPEP_0194356812 /NCGR_PEP_ID=MMETSP0174-20130528/4389_1 /TAXON_ID=216777 /ORGANISM="Proboscia alata, Strain PI-D3" /LENGTH=431 /DNA_ID=CAMNT_0039126565 /DNA_START=812 /DNA_END=2104 /DNA_ORIENTATION=+